MSKSELYLRHQSDSKLISIKVTKTHRYINVYLFTGAVFSICNYNKKITWLIKLHSQYAFFLRFVIILQNKIKMRCGVAGLLYFC